MRGGCVVQKIEQAEPNLPLHPVIEEKFPTTFDRASSLLFRERAKYDNLILGGDAGSEWIQVMAEPEKAPRRDVVEQVLPLVLELIPGQAGEGLIEVHEPGSYEVLSLRKLCERLLSRTNWSLEEQQVLEDVRRLLDGGRLLCRGRQVDGAALDHAVVEETEAGEKYLYIPVRAIKPQEGGATAPRMVRARIRPMVSGLTWT